MLINNNLKSRNLFSKSQKSVWMNCFTFIERIFKYLPSNEQEYLLVFEYSLPGTVHERPDIFCLQIIRQYP